MRRPSNARRAREGAVMVEAVISVSVLTLMFAGLVFLHRLALADIKNTQEARFQAWNKAMNGCQHQDFDLASMVSEVAHGNLPLPDSFVPTGSAEASASTRVEGILSFAGATVTRVARIPCRSLPVRAPPSPGAWLFDIFPWP